MIESAAPRVKDLPVYRGPASTEDVVMAASPQPPPNGVRPLPVLRALVDAADREILQLLARRNALIAEIAQFKREHRVPIRDAQREGDILADRRARAQSLGLSPDLIESMFRLVMWGSRERQAALRAELPMQIEPRTVAIIGGRGGMGRCMAALLGDLGHAVMIADVDTALSPEEAAAAADVTVISVPIDATLDVIRRVGPRIRAEALLMDVTSIKAAPLAAMLESCAGSVVGTHPLFGPTVHSLQGQRVVITPGRGEAWLAWVRTMLRARGLSLVETTAEAHDAAMAVVQVLQHFSTEVMGATLARLGVSVEETLAMTSPIYQMDLWLTARHFAQSPQLYAAIQMNNPQTGRILGAFVAAAHELQTIVATRDHAAFEKLFGAVRERFGSFTQEAMQKSDFLIDRAVERM